MQGSSNICLQVLRRRSCSLVPPLAQLLAATMQPWLAYGAASAQGSAQAARGLHAPVAPRPSAAAHMVTAAPAAATAAAAPAATAPPVHRSSRAARYNHLFVAPLQQAQGPPPYRSRGHVQADERRLQQHQPAERSSDGSSSSSSSIVRGPRMAIASTPEGAACHVYDAHVLPNTWLSHWQQQEERQRCNMALLQATRGRQLRRRVALLSTPLLPQQPSEEVQAASASLLLAAARAAADAAPAASSRGQGRAAGGLQGSAAAQSPGGSAAGSGPRCRVAAAGRSIEAGRNRMADWEWLYGLPDETEAEVEEGVAWPPADAEELEGRLGPQRLRLGGRRVVTARPLWISVHQEEGSTEARLYESVVPLGEGVLRHLSAPLAPFCTASGLRFGVGDLAGDGGPWRNFFVGVVGAVGAVEEEVLWPNQILHRERIMYNVRDALDVARFLATPQRGAIESHLSHLRRIAAERGWRRGWCWHMLCQRWGEAVLREHGISI